MTGIGDKAERAIEAGEPFLPLSPDEAALFANTTEVAWLPGESRRLMATPVLRDGPPTDDNVVTRRARIIRQGALTWLDLRPEIRAAAFRNARLAVDRWAYGRPETCQRALHAAGRVGDGCRFAAAYMFATLAPADLDRLGISWGGERLRDQLLVAADRLMAEGNPCGDVVALALGPWSHGDGQPEDGDRIARAVAHLNAQLRHYNIEAQAGGVFARGLVVRAEDGPRELAIAAFDGSTAMAHGRWSPWRLQLRMATTAPRQWLNLTGKHFDVTICGTIARMATDCAMDDIAIGGDFSSGQRDRVDLTLSYTSSPIEVAAWPLVHGYVIAPRMRWA